MALSNVITVDDKIVCKLVASIFACNTGSTPWLHCILAQEPTTKPSETVGMMHWPGILKTSCSTG